MTGKPSLYPGLFIFTNPCRMVRPVRNLSYGKNEWIGTLEQVGFAYSHVTEVPGIKNGFGKYLWKELRMRLVLKSWNRWQKGFFHSCKLISGKCRSWTVEVFLRSSDLHLVLTLWRFEVKDCCAVCTMSSCVTSCLPNSSWAAKQWIAWELIHLELLKWETERRTHYCSSVFQDSFHAANLG